MSEKVITLKHPVELKTTAGEVIETISTVTLRKLQGGDFLSALDAAVTVDGNVKVGSLLRHLAVKSSRLSADRLNKLEIDDMMDVIEGVQSFLLNGRAIGQTALNLSPEPSDTLPTSENGDQDN